MIRDLVPFVAGLLFAAGLGLSQMTRPDLVIGFLDVTHFDPTLGFVMGGAILVHLGPTRWILRRGAPLLTPSLHLPSRTEVDLPLVGGAMLFGIGWGLAGYCPGPALVASAAGSAQAGLLVLGMALGMAGVQLAKDWSRTRQRVTEPPCTTSTH